MNIVSWNVNGIKAWYDHGGLHEVMKVCNPDILILQETKADDDRFSEYTDEYKDTYKRYHQGSSFKKGYAGVGMLVKNEIADQILDAESIELGDGYESGRILSIQLPKFQLVGVYTLNSGDKDELRTDWDYHFMKYIASLNRPVVIMGDLNVVPEPLDYWSNLERARNTLPGLKDYERDNFKILLDRCKMYDTFRELNPTTRKFSWFSYRGNAYDRNQGWRIDLAIASKSLIKDIIESNIYDDIRYSDHCPIELVINV